MSKALIIIDLQNDYFPGGKFTLVNIKEASENAAKVLKYARENGIKVIHVRHESLKSNAPLFEKGTSGTIINSVVQPLESEVVITKNHPNSFLGTNLSDELGDIKDLIIVGAMTNICIQGTTRHASEIGYNVTVVSDAVTTRDFEFDGVVVPAKYVHASTLATLAFGYASIVKTEDIVY
ncbi:hypothetical protein WICMUC_000026 [Wickerhamomyces mucosus]|uniref:Isochorismatase-like domain-containing protein n=1 Tax=Wickerhamomyces mucosus TaxID=1378264 RepID=A0A9P8TIK5_9ASCO|nr:hypothetical protein WICMUC_000026 [Wickerhamomyces mucosus]